MRVPYLVVALAALNAFPTTNGSPHGPCTGPPPALGIIPVGGLVYVDDRGAQGNGIWIYRESNGIPGLQRGGNGLIVPGDRDLCYDDSATGPDQLIY